MNQKAMTVRADGSENPIEAHLWVCSGKNVGRQYRIEEAEQKLGRAPQCDIIVEDERASQQHAIIIYSGHGHEIQDLNSTNGTYVNNHRIERALLRDGDLIQLGETIFEYLSLNSRPSASDNSTLIGHKGPRSNPSFVGAPRDTSHPQHPQLRNP